MSEFWEGDLKTGYYDKVLTSGLKKNRGIQANWHNITFSRVKKYLSKNISHLDYACGSGSLIGLYSQSSSVGFDISENQINYANSTYQGKGNFYTIDNLDLREHHEKYDIITVLGLLEFLENDITRWCNNDIPLVFEFTPKLINILNRICPKPFNRFYDNLLTQNKIQNYFSTFTYSELNDLDEFLTSINYYHI